MVESGKINEDQLETALQYKLENDVYLGAAMVEVGLLSEEEIIEALSEQLKLPTIDPSCYHIQRGVIQIVPEELAKRLNILPLFSIDSTLAIACSDPINVEIIDELSVETVMEISLVLASETAIKGMIDVFYSAGSYEEQMAAADAAEGTKQRVVSREIAQDTKVIEAVNMLVHEAIRIGTSDIHIDPREMDVSLRYRVDGVLQEYYTVPRTSLPALVSRIKILSEMDIAETRKPQDGRFRYTVEGYAVDIRASTFPTPLGEKVVMRILDERKSRIPLEKMGFSKVNLKLWQETINTQNGLVLVTGPTGSGKTTTLYATLHVLNTVEVNIMTIEDPIEYQVDNINQGAVNNRAGMTFAAALRSMLRQDPDIIMVGEMRDRETVELAIRAALTGHIVFSTLHTNSAAATYSRLLNMGIDPYLVSSVIRGILAQRLIRLLCERCRKPVEPTQAMLDAMKIDKIDGPLYLPGGCMHCKNTGYKGRGGVYELLIPSEDVSNLVNEKASDRIIEQKAVDEGMVTLRESGIDYVVSGKTSLEEAMRISIF